MRKRRDEKIIPDEIEVTPQMIEAGVQVLWSRQENASSGELVEAVYRAMASVRTPLDLQRGKMG
jgi:hypothetical protein